jgi:hypothetical protein
VPVSASDEQGMIDSLPYYVDEAKPGEGTNAVIQWIKERAKNYTGGMLNQSQQENEAAIAERVANPPPDTRGPVGYQPGLLQPDAMRAMDEDIMQRRLANPAPHTGINFNYSPGMLDPTAIHAAEQARILGEKPETAAITQDPSMIQHLKDAIYNNAPTVNVPDMSNLLAGIVKIPDVQLWGGKDTAKAATNPNAPLVPKKVQTTMPSGVPYSPQVPPLGPDVLTKPQKPGSATTTTSGLVISGGSLIPPAPGGNRYKVDPLTGRIIVDDPMQQQLEAVEQPPLTEEVEQ